MASAVRVSPPGPSSFDPSSFDPALLGAVVAQSATYDPERVADAALERLAAGPEDHVLELGCGSGRLLFRLAARARRGRVVGIDPSELMVRHARHRNRSWIGAGRARVEQGWSRDLSSFADGCFDRVLGVHVVCFWTEPARDLEEIRRVLRPGGRLLLGFRPTAAGAPEPDPAARTRSARVPIGRVERWLRWAGFTPSDTQVCGDPQLAWVHACH